MHSKRDLKFLKDVAANNNRDWFHDHKDEYKLCQADFTDGIGKLIARLSVDDTEIASQQAKDCCYRFYRDIRFSPDKSPYKRHFGAYISSHGRKALRGGYYIHMQPGNNMLAFGCYWLPMNILTSCRNEIMARIDEWRGIVESKAFIDAFGKPNEGVWNEEEVSQKGFGIASLKTCPKGFPKDYPHLEYLRMKDYCCWVRVGDDFYEGTKWIEEVARLATIARPMLKMINSVVDDYEF